MTLLRFTAPDGTAVGVDHTEITAARVHPRVRTTLIDLRGRPDDFLTVTEPPEVVIDAANAAKLRDRQAAEWDRKAQLDLLAKQIELARLSAASTPGLSWGTPQPAFTDPPDPHIPGAPVEGER